MISSFEILSISVARSRCCLREDKKSFNAWRAGDAFKEAHGGTSIGAFLGAMVSSLRVLRGAPKPAFYDGLLVQAAQPENIPETVRDCSAFCLHREFFEKRLCSLLLLQCYQQPTFILFHTQSPLFSPISRGAHAQVDGWREVEADGVSLLPTEAFVACNQFHVSGEENCAAFEKR